MNTPNKDRDTFKAWMPVTRGTQSPDEYQTALMSIVETATTSGVFYNSDLREYVKTHNDFIPVEAWEWTNGVEGGFMGYEIYHARDAVDAKNARKENETARARFTAPCEVGTIICNGKKYTKVTITGYDQYGQMMFAGTAGNRKFTATCEPRSMQKMIERAK